MVCRTSAARQTRSGSLYRSRDRRNRIARRHGRPLWNCPAPGASSKEGDRDSGLRSNREGWPGWVREGGTRFLIRRDKRRIGDAVGGGPCPRRDRTQISEAPQAVESLHKCALWGADFSLVLRSAPDLNELRSFSDWGLPEEALLA